MLKTNAGDAPEVVKRFVEMTRTTQGVSVAVYEAVFSLLLSGKNSEALAFAMLHPTESSLLRQNLEELSRVYDRKKITEALLTRIATMQRADKDSIENLLTNLSASDELRNSIAADVRRQAEAAPSDKIQKISLVKELLKRGQEAGGKGVLLHMIREQVEENYTYSGKITCADESKDTCIVSLPDSVQGCLIHVSLSENKSPLIELDIQTQEGQKEVTTDLTQGGIHNIKSNKRCTWFAKMDFNPDESKRENYDGRSIFTDKRIPSHAEIVDVGLTNAHLESLLQGNGINGGISAINQAENSYENLKRAFDKISSFSDKSSDESFERFSLRVDRIDIKTDALESLQSTVTLNEVLSQKLKKIFREIKRKDATDTVQVR